MNSRLTEFHMRELNRVLNSRGYLVVSSFQRYPDSRWPVTSCNKSPSETGPLTDANARPEAPFVTVTQAVGFGTEKPQKRAYLAPICTRSLQFGSGAHPATLRYTLGGGGNFDAGPKKRLLGASTRSAGSSGHIARNSARVISFKRITKGRYTAHSVVVFGIEIIFLPGTHSARSGSSANAATPAAAVKKARRFISLNYRLHSSTTRANIGLRS